MQDTRINRDVDLIHLHPIFRARLRALLSALSAEGLPFRLFEAYRAPARQAFLYGKGRTDKTTPKVTNARPWASFHQYGIAADLVLFEEEKWSWNTRGEKARWWARMNQLAREHKLETLSFELPHVQLRGQLLEQLLLGRYPPGGDATWAQNLIRHIQIWTAAGGSGAPVPPSLEDHDQ